MFQNQTSQEAQPEIYACMTQGSPEWFALRKTKITATDASVIMGLNHWKTKIQLYREKVSDDLPSQFCNKSMQRGLDLEPAARHLYSIMTARSMFPAVVVRDWTMASLDGIDATMNHIVEIKCPGEKDHLCAVNGKVPEHYMPQLQHQMYVCGLDSMDYFSFDGMDGVIIEVKRDQDFIDSMLEQELKFYECLQNKTPPEPEEGDYLEIEDPLWIECAERWKDLQQEIKRLEDQEAHYRKQLIFLSGESNAKGAGISICNIKRKGNVDYGKIPELRGIDLEIYRKAPITSWRITAQ